MPRAKITTAASDESKPADPPSADELKEKPPAPARFESESASLILYAGGKKVAVFSLGLYETDDADVIEVLRGSELVREVGGND
jgi:hypothetical protein